MIYILSQLLIFDKTTKESCPVFPVNVKREHWSLPDLADAKGSEEEVLQFYRQVRDEIKRRVSRIRNKIPDAA